MTGFQVAQGNLVSLFFPLGSEVVKEEIICVNLRRLGLPWASAGLCLPGAAALMAADPRGHGAERLREKASQDTQRARHHVDRTSGVLLKPCLVPCGKMNRQEAVSLSFFFSCHSLRPPGLGLSHHHLPVWLPLPSFQGLCTSPQMHSLWTH